MLERQQQKATAAVTPHLEDGEQIRAMMLGQTPVPPIAYLLIAPLAFIFIIQFKTVVVTDRNVYVFPHKWMRTYEYRDAPYKSPLGSAQIDTGPMYLRIDGGPRIWHGPFGPAKRGGDEVKTALASTAGQARVGSGAGDDTGR